jgi:hypothetical protein
MTEINNKTQLHSVFIQANTLSGYRYLDLSGVVLNRIAELYNEFSVDPSGCLLKKPKNPKNPYSIRFSPDRMWLCYAPVESLTYVLDTASEWIESIAKDIEVSRFSRFGLRSLYFTPRENMCKSAALLSKKLSSDVFRKLVVELEDPSDVLIDYSIRIPLKQYIAGIHVTAVKVLRPPIEPTEFLSDGLLFDLDIYRKRNLPDALPRAETRSLLKSTTTFTYELLESIGYNLMEDTLDGTNK